MQLNRVLRYEHTRRPLSFTFVGAPALIVLVLVQKILHHYRTRSQTRDQRGYPQGSEAEVIVKGPDN